MKEFELVCSNPDHASGLRSSASFSPRARRTIPTVLLPWRREGGPGQRRRPTTVSHQASTRHTRHANRGFELVFPGKMGLSVKNQLTKPLTALKPLLFEEAAEFV